MAEADYAVIEEGLTACAWSGVHAGSYRLERGSTTFRVNVNIGTHCARAIDWWTEVRASSYTYYNYFDDQGDDVLEGSDTLYPNPPVETWNLWLTDAPAQAAVQPVSSAVLSHDLDMPAWKAEDNDYESFGWRHTDYAALVRWDVANGFAYL